jgi:glycerol-3-phosphate cytidylyltransferase-like family protein
VQKIAKIISLFEQIETPKEWEDVFMAARITHENFNKQQRTMRQNARKAELRKMAEVAKARWKEGDRVKFYAKGPPQIVHMGIIIKRNPKRAQVKVFAGLVKGVWAIPYQHLIKITSQEDITQLAIGKMEG